MTSFHEGGCLGRLYIYLFFEIGIEWPCIAITAKSPNLSVVIVLRSQLWTRHTQETDLSAPTLPTGMAKSILRSSRTFGKNAASACCFKMFVIDRDSLCSRFQSHLHLTSSPWKDGGRGII